MGRFRSSKASNRFIGYSFDLQERLCLALGKGRGLYSRDRRARQNEFACPPLFWTGASNPDLKAILGVRPLSTCLSIVSISRLASVQKPLPCYRVGRHVLLRSNGSISNLFLEETLAILRPPDAMPLGKRHHS